MTKIILFNCGLIPSRLKQRTSINSGSDYDRLAFNLKRTLPLLFVLYVYCASAQAQNYTSYLTGNSNDVVTNPAGGICLMGGATEDDNAMKWFLQRANGGDVLVLRASGSNGYNAYLYNDLGVPVNSVETIVCNNALSGNDPYIVQRIQQAEAIWFAGGDQWTYITYWRNTAVATAINQAIGQRNVVIGGTSAGMAIQGSYYFSAQNGTVTSATALSNPFSTNVTIDSTAFLDNAYLNNTITDTHFDNPNRKGRLVTFLARIMVDYGIDANAIACDEYTAVCIDTSGIAHVYGGFPDFDDVAYFVQTNCELSNQFPENCLPGIPLTWNLNGQAIKVYRILGDSTGSKTFNLNTWQSGNGGEWLNWHVNNGSFFEQIDLPINCIPLTDPQMEKNKSWKLFPNPTSNELRIGSPETTSDEQVLSIFNSMGQRIFTALITGNDMHTIDLSSFLPGMYLIQIQSDYRILYQGNVVKQ